VSSDGLNQLASQMSKTKRNFIQEVPLTSVENSNFKQLFLSLSNSTREELIDFRKNYLRLLDEESKRLLDLECNQVVSEVPNDVWKIIFTLAQQSEGKRKYKEKEFRKLSCVSNSWSVMIRELVRVNVKKYKPTVWVFSRVPDIEVLDLSFNRVLNGNPISNDALMVLTNLKDLNLYYN
jgi:hypothetical protein